MKLMQWLFGMDEAGNKWSQDMLDELSCALMGLPSNARTKKSKRDW